VTKVSHAEEANLVDEARLVVLDPGPKQDMVLGLGTGTTVLGRDPYHSDVVLSDASVSRRHALIDRSGQSTLLRDLGSTNGTSVNEVRIDGPTVLHHNDVVAFGAFRTRFEDVSDSSGPPTVQTHVATTKPVEPASFNVPAQSGNHISNVAGSQYNLQMRENFLREVAAAKTRARWLSVIGFVMFVLGAGTYAWAILDFIGGFDDIGEETDPGTVELFGPDVGGVPVGLIGFAVAGIGSMLLIVGIVLHVIATAKRRRADRDFPVFPRPPYH
jgi:hypothetical protein